MMRGSFISALLIFPSSVPRTINTLMYVRTYISHSRNHYENGNNSNNNSNDNDSNNDDNDNSYVGLALQRYC